MMISSVLDMTPAFVNRGCLEMPQKGQGSRVPDKSLGFRSRAKGLGLGLRVWGLGFEVFLLLPCALVLRTLAPLLENFARIWIL